jgi:dipeptidyl aminopeptidase/acylaminoacyl peptidase
VEYNVRTSVHEYGGGAWTILPTGDIIFSNSPDAGVHLLNVDSGNVTSILSNPGSRYADFFPHPHETNLVVAIEEDHQDELDVKNSLVLIDTTNRSKTRSIFSGPDFVTSPRISPDGRYIAWLQWNHPNMPWDGAQLFYSEWNDEISSSGPLQSIKDPKWIAGEHGKSCGEPRWGLDGNLYFLYEQSGYKRIFSTKPNQRKPEEVVLHDLDYVEFGRPEWTLAS